MLRKLSVIKLLFIVKIVSGLEIENFTNYLKQYQRECILSQNVYSCIKYKALSQVTKFGDQIGAMGNGSEMFKIVDINGTGEEINEVLTSRKMNHNLGFLDYLKSQVLAYLSKKAISIQIPEGAQLISDDDSGEESRRRKRRNRHLLIPLLMLVGLIKIKMFAGIMLAALFAFKNIVLFGGLLYPNNNKCELSHHYPTHSHSPESYDYTDSHDEHYGHHGHHDHYNHYNDQSNKIAEKSYILRKFNNI